MATRILALWFILAGLALGQFTDFHVQTSGSNLNAGSTTSDAASFTYANGSWVASTGIFTVASGNPASDIGTVDGTQWASVYVTSGATQTGFVGRITAVSSTTVTVSLTVKAGTAPVDGTSNTTLKVGGAWAGPSGSVTFPFNFVASTLVNSSSNPPRVNWKTGTYAVTAAMTHNNSGVYFEGYSSSVGDNSSRPVIQGPSTGAAFTLLNTSAASNISFENFVFEYNGNSGSGNSYYLLRVDSGGYVRNCIFRNGYKHGVINDDDAIIYECEAYNNGLGGGADTVGGFNLNISGSAGIRLYAHDNLKSGIKADGGVFMYRVISTENTGPGVSSTGDENQFCMSSDFAFNGGSGIHLGLGSEDTMNTNYWNCNFIDNGRYGFESEGQQTPGLFFGLTMGTSTLANTLGGFEHDRWYIAVSNDTTSVTPYSDSTNEVYNLTGASANETGYAYFLQLHPSYSGTAGVIDRGAAQQ